MIATAAATFDTPTQRRSRPPRAPGLVVVGDPVATGTPHAPSFTEAVRLLRARVLRPGEQLTFPGWWLGPAKPPPARPGPALDEGADPDAHPRRRPGRQLRLRFPRKCSTLPRARTITARRLTRAERAEVAVTLADPAWDADRPKTRGDCAEQPRPCPWVGCRFNLYLDVVDRREDGPSVKVNFPDREPGDMPPTGSCALDVAERVAGATPMLFSEVGALMNLSIERVRQLASIALQGARVKQMWDERLVGIRVPASARRGDRPSRA